MRTTLTLDDDVAAALDRLRRARRQTLRSLANEVLREGLRHLTARPKRRAPFETRSVDLGRCLLGSVDDVAEALAVAEGDTYR